MRISFFNEFWLQTSWKELVLESEGCFDTGCQCWSRLMKRGQWWWCTVLVLAQLDSFAALKWLRRTRPSVHCITYTVRYMSFNDYATSSISDWMFPTRCSIPWWGQQGNRAMWSSHNLSRILWLEPGKALHALKGDGVYGLTDHSKTEGNVIVSCKNFR
jgi:hypothetical protein